MQIEQKLPDDMQAKWDKLSAAFQALNASRQALLTAPCASCVPSRTVNGVGQEVQGHFGPRFGWLAVSAPYPCRCAAEAARAGVPADGTERRVYEALADHA